MNRANTIRPKNGKKIHHTVEQRGRDKKDEIIIKSADFQYKSPQDCVLVLPNSYIKSGDTLFYLGRVVSPPPFLDLSRTEKS